MHFDLVDKPKITLSTWRQVKQKLYPCLLNKINYFWYQRK